MAKMPAVAQKAEIRQFEENASETFVTGAAVLLNTDEEVAECGADPSSILGFALHDATDHPEDNQCLVALCEEDAQFWMDGDDAPTQADINQSYGIAKDGDGIWHVDGTDTSNTRVYVLDVDTDRDRYLVKVLEANRQIVA